MTPSAIRLRRIVKRYGPITAVDGLDLDVPFGTCVGLLAERAGRLFWLNPEPKLYWNYGDSVMAAYEPYCDGAFECWTTRHLENFVNVVAGGVPAAE